MGFYRVPPFPLIAKIFGPTWPLAASFRLEAPCNLTYGRRTFFGIGATFGSNETWPQAIVLFPALTDVRGHAQLGGVYDTIEVPKDSGRFYRVSYVDDMGKGFDNEHRFAVCQPKAPWPFPHP